MMESTAYSSKAGVSEEFAREPENFASADRPRVCQEWLPENNGLSFPLTFQILGECQSLAKSILQTRSCIWAGIVQDSTACGIVCPFGYLASIYNLIHIYLNFITTRQQHHSSVEYDLISHHTINDQPTLSPNQETLCLISNSIHLWMMFIPLVAQLQFPSLIKRLHYKVTTTNILNTMRR